MQRITEGAPLLLAILDGLALNPDPNGNAVFHAKTPTLDRLLSECAHCTLTTHGSRVGLPEGQMGNSEVGHLNIGGGRIVEQDLRRINRVIREGKLRDNTELKTICHAVQNNPDASLHCIGLLSEGGVHSEQAHLLALIESALSLGVRRIRIHAITDGRDRPPTASREEFAAFESALETILSEVPDADVCVASIIGRYFAMDRDKRWERTKRAYDLFTATVGQAFDSVEEALSSRHGQGQTDEFIEPIVLAGDAGIHDGDAVLFFNFRADRMRQIVSTLLEQHSFSEFDRLITPTLSGIATLTEYDEQFSSPVLIKPEKVINHYGAVLAAHNMRQIRIAETEKYPHVTYFFNGGVEESLPGETRILVPSPRDVPTYDHKPEMSAHEVTEKLIAAIRTEKPQAIVLNYANCDMVGHTGVFQAAVSAVETVDSCLARVLAAIEEVGGAALVTADHGKR